jgi:pimeloyl-ACP methyl ester carboxylesterase
MCKTEMKLNYKEYGEGEAVIILHGLLGMLDNWHSFAKKLSENYRVIVVDLRNHGKSPHSEDFSYPLLAGDLSELMESIHIPRAHLIGHSMGGKLVMQFIEMYTQKVDKAIVIDIAPKAYASGHEAIFKALMALPLESIESRNQAVEILNSALGDAGTVHFLLKNLNRKMDGTFEWKANIPVLWNRYDSIRSAIEFRHKLDVPILFIQGGNSNYIEDGDKAQIAGVFENSSFIKIDGAGHWVHVDQPEILLITVNQFLSP